MAPRSPKRRLASPPAGAAVPVRSAAREWVEPDWLRALILVAAAFWVFFPALHGDWLWDDDYYFAHNPLINDPAGLWKIWFAPGAIINYFPVTASVQWIQWQLWHDDTLPYHVTNVVLHAVNGLLVWRLFRRLGIRWAWLGGLIFVVHPANVESVAWIAELKNTLSLGLFLVAVDFYLTYEDGSRRADYIRALGFFLLALLAKLTMAAFPFVMLLYAWWKRGRIGRRDLASAAPFLGVSLLLAVFDFISAGWYAQLHHLPPESVPHGGLLWRMAAAGLSLAFYLYKSIWPVGMLPMYPQWKVDPAAPVSFLPWLACLGILCLLGMRRKTWGRHALLGLGFFVLNLAPFLGFIAFPYMTFTWTMDHFLYLPLLGLIGLFAAGVGCIEDALAPRLRPYLTSLLAVVLALLALESRGGAALFINDETLWAFTVDRNPGAYVAQNNLGHDLLADGHPDAALGHLEAALHDHPDFEEAHFNLGLALAQTGRLADAVPQLREAVRLNPQDATDRIDLAAVLLQTGQVPGAIEQDRKALSLDPNSALVHYNLAEALMQAGRIPEAIAEFQEALRLKPDFPEAHNNLGTALIQVNRPAEAEAQFEAALQINPDYATARANLDRLNAARTGRDGHP